MIYSINIGPAALREIAALPRHDQIRIGARIDSLAQNPRPVGCVKLTGSSGLWRIRCGPYRIIYAVEDAALVVAVIKVGNRRDVYRGV